LTGKKVIFAFAGEKIEDGTIKPVVDRGYPFGQADGARRRVDTQKRPGTVVISSIPDWKARQLSCCSFSVRRASSFGWHKQTFTAIENGYRTIPGGLRNL
jgi:hypothetical protein